MSRPDSPQPPCSRRWAALTSIVALVLIVLTTSACRHRSEAPPIEADPSSKRVVAQGAVVGFASEPGAHVWRGIPFAEPPVGDLRWRAPRSPQPWEGVFEALSFGSSCVQFAGPMGSADDASEGEVTGSEDCLDLNVFAPRFSPSDVPTGSDRLPVMYWIHGGGNTIGDARPYDASMLASQQKLIVVSVHYRMGVLGWFAHPALRGGGTTSDDRSGNYGTLDLVRGLEWVQENISAFGGDPNRVSVFGESAGGSNTFTMLLSPRADGLFQRAIVQSGSARTTPMSKAENYVDDPEPGEARSSREVLLDLLIADGSATDRSSARQALEAMSDPEIEKYLRAKSPEELLEVYEAGSLGGMYRMPRLLADGRVLPAVDALDALASGRYNRVPTILGTNRDENRLFNLFGSEHVTKAMGLPLWFNNERLYVAESEYQSNLWKVRGVDAPATRMRKVQGPSVYGYRFDWDQEPKVLWLDLSTALGAAHAFELPFVFGWMSFGPATRFVFREEDAASNRQLADTMMSYWAQFAYTGSPGRGRDGSLPEWKSWALGNDPQGPTNMILDTVEEGAPRMESGVLTQDSVLAALAVDARFESDLELCRLLHGFVIWGSSMTLDDYGTFKDGACSAYPFDEHPWEG